MLTYEQYKSIADRAAEIIGSADPSRADEAWTAMRDETEIINKPSAFYTDIDILRELGQITGEALLNKITPHLSERVNRAMQSRGIDLAHPETQVALAALRDGGAITADEHDLLIGLTQETVFTWPSKSQTQVRPGEVLNALEWRRDGEV